MPDPTTTWICDECGELIECPDHGWVEWLKRPLPRDVGASRGRDIRIVHRAGRSPKSVGCQYGVRDELLAGGASVSDDALSGFLGPDGLTRLLEMIAEHALPTPELLELIKRLHTPGYEAARRYFDRALAEVVIETNVVFGYWPQRSIQAVLDFVAGVQPEDELEDELEEDQG